MQFEHRTLFSSPHISFGVFRCHPSHPNFALKGIARGHLLVFPRTSVQIVREGQGASVSDPNQAIFYHAEQPYQREAIHPDGDRCEWFAFSPTMINSAVGQLGPQVRQSNERPYPATSAPIAATIYLLQRRVVRHVQQRGEQIDRGWVEESLHLVLRRCLESAVLHRGGPRKTVSVSTEREHRELVRNAQRIIGLSFRDRLTVEELAQQVGCSPFHLSRLFRRNVGQSIHRYVTQLRLRTALELLDDPDFGLTELALYLGFSSHSHFTYAFRQHFQITPSQWQRQIRSARITDDEASQVRY